MALTSMIAVKATGNEGTCVGRRMHCRTAALAVTLLALLPATAQPADSPGPSASGKSSAVTLENIPGSTAKRVILTSKAAERLGIETGKVTEDAIVRKQIVSGLVIPPMDKQAEMKPAAAAALFGGRPSAPVAKPAVATPAPLGKGTVPTPKSGGGTFGGFGKVAAMSSQPAVPQPVVAQMAVAQTAAPQPAAAPPIAPPAPVNGEVWVAVTLSPGEWERLAQDKPARILPLATRDTLENEVVAKPSGLPPMEDVKRSMLQVYYVVPGKNHGLALNSRMRVELPLAGSDEKQKIVPYSAVYYDGKGAAWVYSNPRPLEFERKRIGVERVVGDLAVLSDGPPVGTTVVTVGAALLYGAEIFGK